MDKDTAKLYSRYELLNESSRDVTRIITTTNFKDNGTLTVKINGVNRVFNNVYIQPGEVGRSDDARIQGKSMRDYLDLNLTAGQETNILFIHDTSKSGSELGDHGTDEEKTNWKSYATAQITPTTGSDTGATEEPDPGFFRQAAADTLDAVAGGDMKYSPLRYIRDKGLDAAKKRILTKPGEPNINSPEFWELPG